MSFLSWLGKKLPVASTTKSGGIHSSLDRGYEAYQPPKKTTPAPGYNMDKYTPYIGKGLDGNYFNQLVRQRTGSPTGVKTTNPRGSTYRAPAVAAPAVVQPKIYTSEELAKLYGVNYDYDYILNLLNEGSARKRDEVLGQIERDRAKSLRSGQGMFGQYLDALRKTKSNAVATGINKGTLAAQELMALLGTQDKLSETELMMNQLSQKTFDEYATAAGMNKSLAFDNSNAIKQYLGTLSSNLNANDVQRYAAELAAKAAAGGGGGGGGYSYSGGSGYKNQDIEYAQFLMSLGPRERYIISGGR